MRHASLFSGIGGFDLAASWCGWKNIFQVEIDGFCQKVLERNFPNVNRYRDIKQFDGKPYAGTIDIISGGFPCQPYSFAGKRQGSNDDRALWPEMLRVISEIRPDWVVCENVPGIINMELDKVLSDLGRIGYTCQVFVVPACATDAPHRRDRIWIVANTKISNDRRYLRKPEDGQKPESGNNFKPDFTANANSTGWEKRYTSRKSEKKGYASGISSENCSTSDSDSIRFWRKIDRSGKSRLTYKNCTQDYWSNFPTQSPVRTGDDGLPTRLVRSAIKAAGNAIVPQVAYEIFRIINLINS